jgi:hypothetical protein
MWIYRRRVRKIKDYYTTLFVLYSEDWDSYKILKAREQEEIDQAYPKKLRQCSSRLM